MLVEKFNATLAAFIMRVLKLAGLLKEQVDAQGNVTGYVINLKFLQAGAYIPPSPGYISIPAGGYQTVSVRFPEPFANVPGVMAIPAIYGDSSWRCSCSIGSVTCEAAGIYIYNGSSGVQNIIIRWFAFDLKHLFKIPGGGDL